MATLLYTWTLDQRTIMKRSYFLTICSIFFIGSVHAEIYKRVDYSRDSYKPVGQILLENNIISSEQLDEALSLHWRRGVRLGEILEELGFIKEGILNKILKTRESLSLERSVP